MAKRGLLLSRDCSTRHAGSQSTSPAAVPQTRATARLPFRAPRAPRPASAPCAPRSARSRCSTRPRLDVELLAPRDLVEHDRARHRLARRSALALAERLPVDPRLPRIDALIDQPPGELLEPPIHLALDERRRHLEGDACRQLLHQRRRGRRARPRAAPRARGPRARARAARRACRTRPRSLANSSSSSGSDAAPDQPLPSPCIQTSVSASSVMA